MNFRMIGQVIGRVLCIEAALMLLPMVAALAYGESPAPFLITIAVTGGIGLVMWRVRAKSGGMTARDGFLIVGLSWIAMSLFGALLFVLTGDIPNYIDALFETISGLTTTGASVVTAPEEMTRGGMFWRLFTHWIGGMGILVFVLAVLPMSGNRSMHIMRAEVPGPTVGKLVPRIRKTASILYLLYIALTLVEMVLLIAGGMSFYDALLHAFATAGTGGPVHARAEHRLLQQRLYRHRRGRVHDTLRRQLQPVLPHSARQHPHRAAQRGAALVPRCDRLFRHHDRI